MTTDKPTTENVAQTREFLASVGKDELADRFGEELENRAEAAERVVRMKTVIEDAKNAGLDDDPAVRALEERAAKLEDGVDLDVDREPHHSSELAAQHALEEDVVEQFSTESRKELHDHLAAVDEIAASSRDGGIVKHELRARRERLRSILDENDVEAAALIADDAPPVREELSAALADAGEADVGESGSERVEAARLEDRRDEVADDLEDAESALLQLTLQERLDELDDRLADTEA